jgi:hypothetical protein
MPRPSASSLAGSSSQNRFNSPKALYSLQHPSVIAFEISAPDLCFDVLQYGGQKKVTDQGQSLIDGRYRRIISSGH